jgi:cytochrome c5
MKKFIIAAIIVFLTQSISHAQPVTKFTQVDFDFGNVSEGDKTEHVFEFSNTGDHDLLIDKVVATSGSTKAKASSKVFKPGEKGNITVVIDMRGKKGFFYKTVDVYTNDPITPVTTLSLKIHVKDQMHMDQYKATEIFTEKCSGCHVEQGKGKSGWDLFKADCFMCHNAGKTTSLSTMNKKPRADMLKAIKEGVDNTLMPGFDLKYGGPLNETEITSLIDLIKPE